MQELARDITGAAEEGAVASDSGREAETVLTAEEAVVLATTVSAHGSAAGGDS
jgi:hypothetical protein